MVEVHLPQSLVSLFPGAARRVEVAGAASVAEVLERVNQLWPGMRSRLVDAGPRIREHIIIYVDADRADLDTPVAPGNVVRVIAAVSGG